MELTLLGTGCPKVDYKRFGPANLISTKKTKILVERTELESLREDMVIHLFHTHLYQTICDPFLFRIPMSSSTMIQKYPSIVSLWKISTGELECFTASTVTVIITPVQE